MKGLFTILSVLLISWMVPSLASADEIGRALGNVEPAVTTAVDHGGLNPVIAVNSWKTSGKHGYYGRWDHRYRHDRYFDRHRHGHRYFHSPYRPHPFYGKGFYHRPYRGGYFFGFTTCFHSGTVRVCISDPHPYRHPYRYR